jgi:hypothetical protein
LSIEARSSRSPFPRRPAGRVVGSTYLPPGVFPKSVQGIKNQSLTKDTVFRSVQAIVNKWFAGGPKIQKPAGAGMAMLETARKKVPRQNSRVWGFVKGRLEINGRHWIGESEAGGFDWGGASENRRQGAGATKSSTRGSCGHGAQHAAPCMWVQEGRLGCLSGDGGDLGRNGRGSNFPGTHSK